MNILIILFALGALIFCSHIFCSLFNKTKIPNVLLLILIGIILGPVTGLLNPDFLGELSNLFTSITLIVILFESGTHLDIKHIPSTILGTTFITIFNFIGIMALTAALCHHFAKMEWLYCFFLGSALGGTSIAVVMPIIKQINPNKKTSATLLMEATLGDIISLIVSLAIMEGIKTGEICILDIFIDMWQNFLFSIIIGGIIGFFWFITIKKLLVRLKNSMFTTFALAFMIYSVCEYLKLNGGLAVISFGIAFSNFSDIVKIFNKNKKDHTLHENEKNFYSEIVFIFQTYFFVYIGINIQLNNFYHILEGTGLVILILLLRQISVIFLRKKTFSTKGKHIIAALGPKGLVTAVLASLPLQYANELTTSIKNNISPELANKAQILMVNAQAIQDIAYAVVLISIIVCSIMIIFVSNEKEETAEPIESRDSIGSAKNN